MRRFQAARLLQRARQAAGAQASRLFSLSLDDQVCRDNSAISSSSSHCRRKNEAINELNLLYLLSERLLANCAELSMATYNALFEMLVERPTPQVTFVRSEHVAPNEQASIRFENPAILKVIAQLLVQSRHSESLMEVSGHSTGNGAFRRRCSCYDFTKSRKLRKNIDDCFDFQSRVS